MGRTKHLNIGERERLYADQRAGVSLRETARRLRRSHTTLSRELTRNQTDRRIYQPHRAQQAALHRQQTAGQKRAGKSPWLRRFVHDKLTEDWSPEQISGSLAGYQRPGVTPETVYRWIYEPAWKGDTLWVYLRRGQPKRRKYPGRRVQRPWVRNRHFIDERPAVVAARTEYGHWESDLLEGSRVAAHVLSVSVELKSGFVLLAYLPRKTAAAKHAALVAQLGSLPPWLRRSLTTDSGIENAAHQATTVALRLPIYFCHPYHSWEKGSVENVIGLIRQYLPKRTSLAGLTPTDLALIADRLNRRPRKRLGYRTPHELFSKQLGGAI